MTVQINTKINSHKIACSVITNANKTTILSLDNINDKVYLGNRYTYQ